MKRTTQWEKARHRWLDRYAEAAVRCHGKFGNEAIRDWLAFAWNAGRKYEEDRRKRQQAAGKAGK